MSTSGTVNITTTDYSVACKLCMLLMDAGGLTLTTTVTHTISEAQEYDEQGQPVGTPEVTETTGTVLKWHARGAELTVGQTTKVVRWGDGTQSFTVTA